MPPTSKRKRRIRKKLFTDEFSVNVFELKLNLSTTSPQAELDFLDTLISKLESMNLCYMGHFLEERLRGHVLAKGRYESPTEAQRVNLLDWCSSHDLVKKVHVGQLVDGNKI